MSPVAGGFENMVVKSAMKVSSLVWEVPFPLQGRKFAVTLFTLQTCPRRSPDPNPRLPIRRNTDRALSFMFRASPFKIFLHGT
jgi:hypothetical protein